ncbi:GrpB family protein [Mycetocola zhadangensis]|uniref:GrpB family protein n=1 Tax=Mycetocola zhadangensis TaxID=1164595 RepID=A0A3L7J1P1_9MICO|nr:GrpB family protein [Mycetocola zhadangensis]RLQ84319.1 hypothetical protein D9V28_08940 [Mycetocola zhadangensis]GGE94133.1 hypothetical protein GCM10011313_16350 [Mycetocola zhadangensis]
MSASPTPGWQLTTGESVANALSVLQNHRLALTRAGVPGELTLTGGSSIAGLLTKGDIDLHLRVAPDDFAVAITQLPLLYRAALREIWTPTFAVFEQASEPPVGVAVTVVGTEHDVRFVESWKRMRTDEAARHRYNALKADGGDMEEGKSRFFDALVDGTA